MTTSQYTPCRSISRRVLTGSHGGSIDPHVEIPRLIKLWRVGKLSLEGLITHRFTLDEINEALDLFKSGLAGPLHDIYGMKGLLGAHIPEDTQCHEQTEDERASIRGVAKGA